MHHGRRAMVWQTMIRNDADNLCAEVTLAQLVTEVAA